MALFPFLKLKVITFESNSNNGFAIYRDNQNKRPRKDQFGGPSRRTAAQRQVFGANESQRGSTRLNQSVPRK